jgi:hypothetical protein
VTADTAATDRASLHALVEALPASDLADVRQLLKTFTEADPALRTALLAPYDDEPFTDEDRAAVEAAEAGYRRGEWITNDEMKRQLGL